MPEFSFLAGADAGDPNSYQSLLMRQKIALAMMGRGTKGYPKNIGEGLTAMGEGFGERFAEDRAQNQLAAFEKYQKEHPSSTAPQLLNQPGAGAAPAAAPAAVAPRAQASPFDTGSPPMVVGGSDETDNPMMAFAAPTAPEVPQQNPTEPGADTSPVMAASGGPSPDNALLQARQNAIGGIESGGRGDPYQTVGVPTKYGPALGRYGVVAANVGPWSKAALGQELTPQQFLASKEAQDAIFNHRMGQYADQYGEENAARAWFGGPGNINNTNATDAFGRLNVGTYGQDYMRRMQGMQRGAPTSALTTGDTLSDAPPLGVPTGKPILATDPEVNPPTPTDIKPMPQVAQAGGVPPLGAPGPSPDIPQTNRITPPVTMPGADKPPLPTPAPMNKAEIEGYRLLDLGQRLQNPVQQEQGKTLIEAGKAFREKQNADAMKQYEFDMQVRQARILAQEEAERKAKLTQQGVINPAVPMPSGSSPGQAVGVDQSILNTPRSPQRIGRPVSQRPPGISEQAWQEQQAPIAAKAVEAVQTAVPQFNDALKIIQLARTNPGGLRFGVGAGSFMQNVPNTLEYGFGQIMKQLQGENFMSGYQSLRGGGQISNVEGEKTQQARARLATAQTREDFDKGLADLEISLRRDLETAQRKVNMPVTAWQHSPNDNYAPDIGTIRPDKKTGRLQEYLGGNPADESSYRNVR